MVIGSFSFVNGDVIVLKLGIDGIWNGNDVGNWNVVNGLMEVDVVVVCVGFVKLCYVFNYDLNICCIGWVVGLKLVLFVEVFVCVDVDEFFDVVIICFIGDLWVLIVKFCLCVVCWLWVGLLCFGEVFLDFVVVWYFYYYCFFYVKCFVKLLNILVWR